jgi:hypothetical protein
VLPDDTSFVKINWCDLCFGGSSAGFYTFTPKMKKVVILRSNIGFLPCGHLGCQVFLFVNTQIAWIAVGSSTDLVCPSLGQITTSPVLQYCSDV